jgi:hypothetical protein
MQGERIATIAGGRTDKGMPLPGIHCTATREDLVNDGEPEEKDDV